MGILCHNFLPATFAEGDVAGKSEDLNYAFHFHAPFLFPYFFRCHCPCGCYCPDRCFYTLNHGCHG